MRRRTSITFELPPKEAYDMSDDKKEQAKQVAAENGMYVIICIVYHCTETKQRSASTHQAQPSSVPHLYTSHSSL